MDKEREMLVPLFNVQEKHIWDEACLAMCFKAGIFEIKFAQNFHVWTLLHSLSEWMYSVENAHQKYVVLEKKTFFFFLIRFLQVTKNCEVSWKPVCCVLSHDTEKMWSCITFSVTWLVMWFTLIIGNSAQWDHFEKNRICEIREIHIFSIGKWGWLWKKGSIFFN